MATVRLHRLLWAGAWRIHMALSLASMVSVRTCVQIYRDIDNDTKKFSSTSVWNWGWCVCYGKHTGSISWDGLDAETVPVLSISNYETLIFILFCNENGKCSLGKSWIMKPEGYLQMTMQGSTKTTIWNWNNSMGTDQKLHSSHWPMLALCRILDNWWVYQYFSNVMLRWHDH